MRYKRISKHLIIVASCGLLAWSGGCGPHHVCREIAARTYQAGRVVDGDTFKVVYDGEVTSVRLCGIDAPELPTGPGRQAKAALRVLIGGQAVRLEFAEARKRDNFGRLLCKVYVGDTDVGAEMIRQGHAKPYAKSTKKKPQ